MYLAELIISNHSLLWPGQHCLVPFGFAVVVFSSLRVLTKMTVIVISCTNCLLFIRAMVSMGSANGDPAELAPSPPWSLARSRGLAAQPGIAGKGEEEKKFLQVFCLKVQAGFVLQGLFGSAWGCRALQSCSGAHHHPSVPSSSRTPAGHLSRARGGSSPRNLLFSALWCCFPPKVQPVARLTPLGTAGLISSPWQLFMLLSGNYSFA